MVRAEIKAWNSMTFEERQEFVRKRAAEECASLICGRCDRPLFEYASREVREQHEYSPRFCLRCRSEVDRGMYGCRVFGGGNLVFI